MQPNITQVEWSATGIPSGVSFNTQTGTFSGTPTAAGTYTVPVHVETNYGEDTKNITIAVRTTEYELLDGEVYILDGQPEDASTWKEDNESYGRFVKYETPQLKELVYLNNTALAGKTVDGDFYYEGAYDFAQNNDVVEGAITLPNVEEIYSYTSPTQSILLRKADGTVEIKRPPSISDILEYQGSCDLLIPPSANGKASFLSDNMQVLRTITTRTFISSEDIGYKVKKYIGHSKGTYLSKSGYLDNDPSKFTSGIIKDAVNSELSQVFVVTEDDEVYKYDRYNEEWVDMGTYPVKKICISHSNETFLLTEDGKLYLHGTAVMTEGGQLCFDYSYPHAATIATTFKDGFTQIYPDEYFYDITTYGQKLVVIKR